MSEKKRLSGITVIGVSEILLGLAGCVIFLSAIGIYFANAFSGIEFGFTKNSYAMMHLSAFLGIATIPFALILITGIGMLNTRLWAQKINIFIIPLVVIPIIFVWTIKAFSHNWIEAAIKAIPVGVLLIANIKYLSHPKVNEHFVEGED